MSSVWDGVDIAVIRDAAQDSQRSLNLTLGRNLFGGQALLYVATTDPFNPRRKPVRILPGPLVADNHADLLRAVADILDGTIKTLSVTDAPAPAASSPASQAVTGAAEQAAASVARTDDDTDLLELARRVVMDFGSVCTDPDSCDCSMTALRRRVESAGGAS